MQASPGWCAGSGYTAGGQPRVVCWEWVYSRQKEILLVRALLHLVILRLELPKCPLDKFAEHLTFKQPSLQTRSHLLSDGFRVNM